METDADMKAVLTTQADALDADLREMGWRRTTRRVIDTKANAIRCEAVDEDGKRWSVLWSLPEPARSEAAA